jgi:ribonucleoside-diphosphate reductase alpha chain
MTDHTAVAPSWLSQEGIQTLSSGYLLPGETPKSMIERVASTAAKLNSDPSLERDLFHCLWNGWIGLASPVAANFGTSRALPISCYSVHLSDDTSSIYSHKKEVAMLSKNGGGVGVYFGDIRPAGSPISGGGISTGKLGWMREYDLTAQVVSQGGDLRKGSFALYNRIDDPDYPEMLRAKDHTKGDPRLWIDSNVGAVVSDSFMEDMIENGGHKQWLFGESIRTRLMSGSPYMLFIDNVNKQNPLCYIERGLEVSVSNLCSEITLYTDEHHSFVCVLSSMNLSRWFEWSNWRSPETGRSAPEVAIHLLEAVVTEFIRKAEKMTGFGRAVRFARKSRALGLGTMGLHSLYQSQMLPFRSDGARALNIETHKFIREQAEKASKELASRFGEPEWCEGRGMRHTHLLAIAPTKTNSVITGAYSEGISPMDYNYFVAKQDKGTFVRKNPHLEKLLCEKNAPADVWDRINKDQGSVQTLDCLTDGEKEVFKTAREIDQFELVKQAADRQPFICQAQSLNLFVDPYADAEYLLRLHISAWKSGVKSLYYLKSKSPLIASQDEIDDDGEDSAIIITKDDCSFCSALKSQLNTDGVSFIEVPLEKAKADGMWSENWKQVPQLYINNRWIGGYTEYMEEQASGNFNVPTTQEVSYNDCAACEA